MTRADAGGAAHPEVRRRVADDGGAARRDARGARTAAARGRAPACSGYRRRRRRGPRTRRRCPRDGERPARRVAVVARRDREQRDARPEPAQQCREIGHRPGERHRVRRVPGAVDRRLGAGRARRLHRRGRPRPPPGSGTSAWPRAARGRGRGRSPSSTPRQRVQALAERQARGGLRAGRELIHPAAPHQVELDERAVLVEDEQVDPLEGVADIAAADLRQTRFISDLK